MLADHFATDRLSFPQDRSSFSSFVSNEDKMEEECGVFGMWAPEGATDAAEELYRGLLALQHRGQESAGITIGANSCLHTQKGSGLISQVFDEHSLGAMDGHLGIGHVRYSTAGGTGVGNAQPLQGKSKLGDLAVAHNGTLVNAGVLRSLLEDGGALFRTETDSEVLLAMIARRAAEGLEGAVAEAMSAVKGSYALVMAAGDKLLGARDPHGIRPLVLGRREDRWYLASESCALAAVGAETVRDLEPGEVILIDADGPRSIVQDLANERATCVFEYIYFARPDSRIDGISVMNSRLAMGRELAREWKVQADLVCGVPDSGVPAALGFSRESGVPYGLGFIKNHYVGRTFIHPDQAMRERAVSVKLSVMAEEVEGKRVLLIDDSIVRGTTSRRLVNLMREAGAKEVLFGVVSPPVQSPCYFGIDTPVAEDLIAHKMDIEAICNVLGADELAYLSLEGLKRALGKGDGFCLGCLTGTYPIPPHRLRA